MTTACRALWLVAENRAVLKAEALDDAAQGSVMVESRFGAISRGTEALVAAGRVPPSEYRRMRAPFQAGDFPFPVKYGYAVVGEVVKGLSNRLGETVFCLHPHQDRFVVPDTMAVSVPANVPAERAVLAANMETALNIVWDARILPGDRLAVVGGGLVGLLVAYLAARIPGAEVTVVDIDARRADIARSFGCAFAAPANAPVECDVVVHCSASGAGLATALAAAGFEARIVEASWYGQTPVSVPLGGAFHSQRLSIVASQVGHVPPERRARWPLGRRIAKALSLLADERLDRLFSGQTRFDDLPDTYHGILAAPDTLCHRILYDRQ